MENEREGWGSGGGWLRRQRNGISDEEVGKNLRPLSVPASPRTSRIKKRATEFHSSECKYVKNRAVVLTFVGYY